jgi:hypothetical protein
MTLRNLRTGLTMSDEEAQGYMKKLERIIFAGPYQPPIGEVRMYAGLPLKVVRYATLEEHMACNPFPEWPPAAPPEGYFFFEVEVAD